MCGSISHILIRYYCYYGKDKLEEIKVNIYNRPKTEGTLSKGSAEIFTSPQQESYGQER